MNRIGLATIAIALAILAVIYVSSSVGVFHCGRCGAQKWDRRLLWMDFGEPDYDEFGIEERWVRAHKRACSYVWLPGPLAPDSRYWSSLELAIAKGEKIISLRAKIATASDAELRYRDAFGRSIMHWLAIHPDEKGRALLINELERRGLKMTVKDADGLSPLDWQENSKS